MGENIYKGSKILLVEDEETLAIGLEYNLTEEGFDVKWAKNGRQAIDFYEPDKFDLVILDIMLPYIDGFEIAEHIRSSDPKLPILMLTARTEKADRVKGLEKGVDDYVTKPFHLDELLLRVRGMLKRKNWYHTASKKQPVYKFGSNEINFENLKCVCGSKELKLTQLEAMMLKYFVENEGKIVTRKEMLENIWHLNPNIETRTVDIFIARLRKLFEPNPSKPIYFESVRGVGYTFSSGRS